LGGGGTKREERRKVEVRKKVGFFGVFRPRDLFPLDLEPIASSDLAPLAHPLFRFLSFFSLPVYRNKYHLETHLRKSSGKGGRGSRGGAALSASQPAGVTAGGGDASFGRHFERQHFFCSFFCASMSF